MRSRRITALITAFVLMTGCLAPVYGARTDTSRQYDVWTEPEYGVYDVFANYVDGYMLYVDRGMDVDMSLSGVCAVLTNEHKRIEIYKQNIAKTGKAGYINYSNKFLYNDYDCVTDYNGTQTIGDRDVYITAWHRDKLYRVENDLNYYIILDIVEGRNCYTIQVKADSPINDLGGYVYLVSGFSTFAPTQSPSEFKTQPVDTTSRGWND